MARFAKAYMGASHSSGEMQQDAVPY